MKGCFDEEGAVKIDGSEHYSTSSSLASQNGEQTPIVTTADASTCPPISSIRNEEESHHPRSTSFTEVSPVNQDEYQPASCMQQTRALIAKNLLNKVRTPMGTILELLSPALFMWVLVFGYSLSEERFRNMGSYAQWEFDLPNEILGSNILSLIDETAQTSTNDRLRERSLLEQKMSRLNFLFDYDENEEDEEDVELISNYDGHLFQWKDAYQLVRMLQSTENSTEEEIFDDDFAAYETVASSFDGFRRELRKLLRSPMPIPSIGQYLLLSQSLSSQFNPNELDLVYQNSDYIRRWGNILTLGTVHLSPKGKITEDFITYLEDVYNLRNISSPEALEDRPNATSILLRVHEDADSATQYVMDNLEERTFVSINFHEVDDVS